MKKIGSKNKYTGPYNGKLEQIKAISAITGISRRIVEDVLNAQIEVFKDKLMGKEEIHITGVGTITYKYQKREITSQFNPGADYGVFEWWHPRFIFSKEFMRMFLKKYKKKVDNTKPEEV